LYDARAKRGDLMAEVNKSDSVAYRDKWV